MRAPIVDHRSTIASSKHRGTTTAVPDTLRHPWLIVAAVAAVLAAWMGLGTLHDSQHADSLLTVLISTQRWTPFFWGQDRFGMLVPLAAMPIRHPLTNLLVQGWIMTVAALLAPFVMARFLTQRAGAWIAIGACTNTLFLLVARPAVQFDWFVTQPYALSIVLGFAALIVADGDDRRRATMSAAALLVLASWVNIGIVVLIAVAAVVISARRIRLLALAAAAFAVTSLAARNLAPAHTITALAPVWKWPNGWWQLLEGSADVTARPTVGIGIAGGTAIALVWLWRTDALPSSRTVVGIVMMAVGSWLVVGTSLWVGMNRYAFRYMYPTLMIAGLGVSTVFAALFAKRIKELSVASMVALLAVAVASYGTPSLGRVERSLDDRFGRQTATLLHNGVTVLAGDYWRVWPAVFHANLALARTRSHARLFGLAFRSEGTDPLWKGTGRPVVLAGWHDDRSLAAVADEHGVRITLLAHLPEMDLYTAQP